MGMKNIVIFDQSLYPGNDTR